MSNLCKILIVDDEPLLKSLILQKFKSQIDSNHLNFQFAGNGNMALEILASDPNIGVVVTDIKMPEMDGLTLLHHLTEQDRLYKIIVVSAYGDMSNIRKAMEEGASDFILKPFDLKDFEASLLSAVNQFQYLKQGLLAKDGLVELSKELSIAKQIKQALIPENFSPFPQKGHIALVGEMIPSEQLGGDFYDFFQISEQELGIVVANVKSRGLPAALYTAMIQSLARAVGMSSKNPSECVQEIHEFLLNEIPSNVISGLFYAVYNDQTNDFNYCNTGDILVYKLSETKKLLQDKGKVSLQKSDKIFITTKEMINVNSEEREAYGLDRLERCFETSHELSSQDLVQKIKEDVLLFTKGSSQQEDIPLFSLQTL